ncbi:DUF3047 domain-containing protein [Geotalea sp. SG265]|uniref:DUF3047 domain-containing protein n=1 Tax=Geotalea sp. SG265 TaxID=2922867 RepID=UPI001FAF9CBC|nr:DUF3047 domain-containing protein [Geotalea sp. SG265]
MPILLIALILALVSAPSLATELAVGKFSTDDLGGWTEKPFRGKTLYSLTKDEGKSVLMAHSLKAGSGLIKKLSVDTRKFPILRWSWKIDHTLQKEDIKTKKGDDFAARVYVIFPRTFFWRMRAINYVWSAKMAKESFAPSPYTSNSVIIAVESGDESVKKWVSEERNIYDDYRKVFGEEPPLLGGVAIMTDTDDTQDEATAYYGDIFLVGKPQGAPEKVRP